MNKKKIITIPHPHYVWPPQPSKSEIKELIRQRKSDISIAGRTGPIKRLEEHFLQFLDNKVKYCITFNSGTSAILASFFALGIDEGDEVIGPALTYHAALSPLFFLKATPILIDVERKSRCIDPNKIESAISKKTKAIVVVHQWGHPADMDRILTIAKKYRLKILEDCSHAHGSLYKNKQVGTFGDIAVFSFQAAKVLYAGEGGLLVTNNQELHDRATLLGHYRDRSREEIKNAFYQQFWVTGYGLKLRMSPFDSIVAYHALKKIKHNSRSRKKCLTYFINRLKEIPEIETPFIEDWADMGGWYGFKPILKEDLLTIDRKKYIEELQKEGVEIDIPGSPVLSDLPLYAIKEDKMFKKTLDKMVSKSKDFPVSHFLASKTLSLPTFTQWPQSKKIIDQYIDAFKKIGKLYKK